MTRISRNIFIGLFALFLLAPVTQPVHAATLIVTNTADNGAGSLRAQIAAASPDDTINFDASLSGQTITLTSGEIAFSKNLIIDGSALASPVTISGNNNERIFYISGGATVSITSLRFINGNSSTGDSGDWDGDGGAIYVRDSTLTVSESEFDNNQAEFNGGAIYILDSEVTISNNTFTNNSVVFGGGAIYIFAPQIILITGNTFVSNTSNEGGAILSVGGAETLNNNTFANNTGTFTVFTYRVTNLNNNTFLGDDGVFARNSDAVLNMRNNIIGQCILVNGGTVATNINNWIVNGSCSPAYSGNPYLMPLADNGGSTQTAALIPFSGALNAGTSDCLATDQRGQGRGATCDLGAYETQTGDHQTDQCYSGLVQGETYGFGATGVLITIDTLGSLTQLCARLTQSNHPNATTGIQTNRYWTVTPTAGANDWSLTMSAPVDFTLDGNDKLCRYTGSGTTWDCDMTSTDNTANRITRSNITQLSPWAVGNDVGPTAVTLSNTNSTSSMTMTIVASIILALTCITLIFFKRRSI